MSQKFKPKEKVEEDNFDVGYKVPETQGLLSELDSAYLEMLRTEHKEETEEEEKQGRPKKQKRGGTICCCGVPHCRIGPFTERN